MSDVIESGTPSEAMSRRSLLTRLGVGTAIVWAAPVLSTINVPAGAVAQTAACRERAKDGAPACGICSPAFCTLDINQDPPLVCGCVPTIQSAGCCTCVTGAFLFGGGDCPSTSISPNCNRDNQCPTDWKCVYNCNCPPTSLQFRGRCVPRCGAHGCTHSVCVEGPPLQAACDPCAAQVCATDPFCCNIFWDGVCVSGAVTVCGPCTTLQASSAGEPSPLRESWGKNHP